MGGDLYDFFDIDPAHVGLVIGDVSGKGVPASLFMMIAKVLIREYARTGLSPAEVLTRANQTLCSNNKNDMFVTAWFGILDRTNGNIVAASAGHEFPILRKEGEEFNLIKDRRQEESAFQVGYARLPILVSGNHLAVFHIQILELMREYFPFTNLHTPTRLDLGKHHGHLHVVSAGHNAFPGRLHSIGTVLAHNAPLPFLLHRHAGLFARPVGLGIFKFVFQEPVPVFCRSVRNTDFASACPAFLVVEHNGCLFPGKRLHAEKVKRHNHPVIGIDNAPLLLLFHHLLSRDGVHVREDEVFVVVRLQQPSACLVVPDSHAARPLVEHHTVISVRPALLRIHQGGPILHPAGEVGLALPRYPGGQRLSQGRCKRIRNHPRGRTGPIGAASATGRRATARRRAVHIRAVGAVRPALLDIDPATVMTVSCYHLRATYRRNTLRNSG